MPSNVLTEKIPVTSDSAIPPLLPVVPDLIKPNYIFPAYSFPVRNVFLGVQKFRPVMEGDFYLTHVVGSTRNPITHADSKAKAITARTFKVFIGPQKLCLISDTDAILGESGCLFPAPGQLKPVPIPTHRVFVGPN
jgi:hypothetical protein